MNETSVHEEIAGLLRSLQDHIRKHLLLACSSVTDDRLSRVAASTDADVIYQIDTISEELILDWFAENWPASLPVELVMEGLEERGPVCFPEGTHRESTRWKCLMDPIDGTRNIMYDKRSAWALAGVARQHGEATSLSDIEVAAMTALPASREWRSDQIVAIRGRGITAHSFDVRTGQSIPLELRPSQAQDCRHGFACITRFFPDGLEYLSRIEENLWMKLYPDAVGDSPVVFNDQYLTSGGQLYELMIGHDRFIADLRPLVFKKLGYSDSLSCHPYDLSALLVAEESGIIVEDPLTGQPVNAPLDTTTPVSWVAYANPRIAEHVRPALRDLLRELL